MKGKAKLMANWLIGLLLVLAFFYVAVSWLWRASEESAAASLRSQVLSALSGDLAEGNLFKLGATLTKLRQEGHIRFAEIRQVRGGISSSIYRTSGVDEGVKPAFSSFTCDSGHRLVRVSDSGVGLVTVLPTRLSGAECAAVFISSDLSADLKKLKVRITASFGALIILVMGFVLVLTISWHKKGVVLEVLAKTAVAEKEAAIGRMAAQVAHDIRSPLAALETSTGGLNMTAEQQVLVKGAIGRIQGIANDLLAKYRHGAVVSTEAASGAVPPAVIDAATIVKIIESTLSEKRLQYQSKSGLSINFTSVLQANNVYVMCHSVELPRIISNLINNSAEAMEAGNITVSLVLENKEAIMKVRDTGKGIPIEILTKLGRKGETHGKVGGTGLGLYHARTCAEAWGGTLAIESKSGKGTTVTITLPRVDTTKTTRVAVLIDDDILVHMTWKVAARSNGIALKAFRSPSDFLTSLETLPRDVPVYIDSDLGGGIKGEEIAKTIYAKGFETIYLETGHSPGSFPKMSWIKGVISKEPPWAA